ncbi:unnamed protein product [Citrullus colocynthis]|uniref:Uncharacterized protein n=1 Tax=Citrullus colocynthis TaxID=252529 RepID=A0ABP0XSS4_9ROSI
MSRLLKKRFAFLPQIPLHRLHSLVTFILSHQFCAPRSLTGLQPPLVAVVRSAAHRHRRLAQPSLSSPSVAVACSIPSSVAKHPAQFEAISSVSDRSFLYLGWSVVGDVEKA